MSISRIQWMRTVVMGLAVLAALACTSAHHRSATVQVGLAHHTTPWATSDCVAHRSPDRVSGTEPDGAGDGPDAILTFQHAYHVLRSGTAAREVVATDAKVGSAVDIQNGIDWMPIGTRYCVHITPAPGQQQWNVELSQQHPGKPEVTLHQTVTTTRTDDGRTLITAITTA